MQISIDQIHASTTSIDLRSLEHSVQSGWVRREGDLIRLTETGHIRATRARKALEIWREWLTSEASIDRDLIDLDEVEIEKILSPELIDTLQRSIDDRERP